MRTRKRAISGVFGMMISHDSATLMLPRVGHSTVADPALHGN